MADKLVGPIGILAFIASGITISVGYNHGGPPFILCLLISAALWATAYALNEHANQPPKE